MRPESDQGASLPRSPKRSAASRSEPFVRFPISIYDGLLRSPMPATHKEVALAVIRRTYGNFGKTTAPISLALFGAMTGRARRGIQKALSELMAEGVLVRVIPPDNRYAAVYSLSPHPESWGKFRPRPATTRPATDGEWYEATTLEVNQPATPEWQPATTIVDRRPIEDLPSVGAASPDTASILRLLPESCSTPHETPHPQNAHEFVAHAARYAHERGLTLTAQTKGQLGREVKKLRAGGASPELLTRALELLIEENRSPSHLRYMLGDLERGHALGRARKHRTTTWDEQRSRNGEFV